MFTRILLLASILLSSPAFAADLIGHRYSASVNGDSATIEFRTSRVLAFESSDCKGKGDYYLSGSSLSASISCFNARRGPQQFSISLDLSDLSQLD